ncbi:hypothetical protein HDV00_006295 [Rhizophlyctis rosea]|nr:hypothetical protein HDV00_006295 [Rhizophlyctis rosea]
MSSSTRKTNAPTTGQYFALDSDGEEDTDITTANRQPHTSSPAHTSKDPLSKADKTLFASFEDDAMELSEMDFLGPEDEEEELLSRGGRGRISGDRGDLGSTESLPTFERSESGIWDSAFNFTNSIVGAGIIGLSSPCFIGVMYF